jgi:DNA-binding CsgD family transcriptional regulator
MFDSFQIHPRLSEVSGNHNLGMHSVLVFCDETKFGWRNAPDVSFSKPFESDPSPNLPPVEASVRPYDALQPLLCLSPREKEVLLWAGRGKSAWETAQLLGLSEATVKSYVRNACSRLGVKNKTHAVAVALTNGLLRI